jgi:hypothetical protein
MYLRLQVCISVFKFAATLFDGTGERRSFLTLGDNFGVSRGVHVRCLDWYGRIGFAGCGHRL